MTTRLSDPREIDAMTAEQADELFAELAQADIRAKKAQAAAEKKIADIKAKCEEETEEDAKAVKELADRLSRYILAHRERFQKPRQRQTPFGKYGLRTATKLQVPDEAALIAFARENGLDILDTKTAVNKTATQKAIAEGEDLGGLAQVVSGDVASYDVDRKLLKA